MILRERRNDPRMTISVANGQAILQHNDHTVCAFPTAKQPRETIWDLAAIALRGTSKGQPLE